MGKQATETKVKRDLDEYCEDKGPLPQAKSKSLKFPSQAM
jgi:hypothetical protein